MRLVPRLTMRETRERVSLKNLSDFFQHLLYAFNVKSCALDVTYVLKRGLLYRADTANKTRMLYEYAKCFSRSFG